MPGECEAREGGGTFGWSSLNWLCKKGMAWIGQEHTLKRELNGLNIRPLCLDFLPQGEATERI